MPDIKTYPKVSALALLIVLVASVLVVGYVVILISQPTVGATGLTAEDVHIESETGIGLKVCM